MNKKGLPVDILTKLFALFGSELCVEWIINISMAKLNNLKANIVYSLHSNLEEFIAISKIYAIKSS